MESSLSLPPSATADASAPPDLQVLESELAELFVTALNLEMAAADIDPTAPLFGDGLGLDSIDALELVVALEKIYNVFIPDSEVGKKVFRSVNALAEFVKTHRA